MITEQIEALKAEGKLDRIEPRCKICREEPVRRLVNKLLGLGITRPAVVDALEVFNASREPKDRITYDNVYHHQKRHFDPSQPARAVYDAIVKRRAAETDPDYENAVGAKVNALSYLETMMLKGYETLIDEETTISPTDGAKAAVQLHELTRKDAGPQQIAEIMARQNRIIAAIQEVVPPQYVARLLERLDGPATAIEAATIVDDEDDDFDPTDIDDGDDD